MDSRYGSHSGPVGIWERRRTVPEHGSGLLCKRRAVRAILNPLNRTARAEKAAGGPGEEEEGGGVVSNLSIAVGGAVRLVNIVWA